MKNEPKSSAAWQAAGKAAYKELQDSLNQHNGGLDKVAKVLTAGLDAQETKHFVIDGKVKKTKVTDYKTQATYCKLIIEVFGAKMPDKLQHSLDKDAIIGILSALPVEYAEAVTKSLPRYFNAD